MPNAIAKASKHELKCAWDILAQAAAKQQQQQQPVGWGWRGGKGQSRAIDGIDGRSSFVSLSRVHVDGCLLRFESQRAAGKTKLKLALSQLQIPLPTPLPLLLFSALSFAVFFAFFNAHWLWLHWLILLPLVAVAAFGF